MENYRRQQFDVLLATAVERFAERIIQRNGGPEPALERLRAAPHGEGIWLDDFTRRIFEDFLLDNAAGAAFVLEALARRPAPVTVAAAARTVEDLLLHLARAAFADLLARKTEEVLEQRERYEPVQTPEAG
ncbi:MAG TPA: hypothetical protein DD490_05930 [Acidobacteria bacterium]|nr:hypothetical protein [Acidobacteriota bacterium]